MSNMKSASTDSKPNSTLIDIANEELLKMEIDVYDNMYNNSPSLKLASIPESNGLDVLIDSKNDKDIEIENSQPIKTKKSEKDQKQLDKKTEKKESLNQISQPKKNEESQEINKTDSEIKNSSSKINGFFSIKNNLVNNSKKISSKNLNKFLDVVKNAKTVQTSLNPPNELSQKPANGKFVIRNLNLNTQNAQNDGAKNRNESRENLNKIQTERALKKSQVGFLFPQYEKSLIKMNGHLNLTQKENVLNVKSHRQLLPSYSVVKTRGPACQNLDESSVSVIQKNLSKLDRIILPENQIPKKNLNGIKSVRKLAKINQVDGPWASNDTPMISSAFMQKLKTSLSNQHYLQYLQEQLRTTEIERLSFKEKVKESEYSIHVLKQEVHNLQVELETGEDGDISAVDFLLKTNQERRNRQVKIASAHKKIKLQEEEQRIENEEMEVDMAGRLNSERKMKIADNILKIRERSELRKTRNKMSDKLLCALKKIYRK